MALTAPVRPLREQFPRLVHERRTSVRELEQLRGQARRFADAHMRPRAILEVS
jgi:hypothetical protein